MRILRASGMPEKAQCPHDRTRNHIAQQMRARLCLTSLPYTFTAWRPWILDSERLGTNPSALSSREET